MNDEIEKFYSDLERQWPQYKRPLDYKERYLRILNGERKPVRNQREGRKKKFNVEE